MDDLKYLRRKDDQEIKLLARIDERSKNMEARLDRIIKLHETRLDHLEKLQACAPCESHSVRISSIERLIRAACYLSALTLVGIAVGLAVAVFKT